MATFTYHFKNYRTFPQSRPLSIQIHDGITFILGPNNVGKSTLLRAFHDLRGVMKKASEDSRKYNSNLPQNFELVANRGSRQEPIEVEISSTQTSWILVISAGSGIHQTSVNVTMYVKGEAPTEEVRRRAFSIFTDCLYVPSFRSTTVNAQEALHGMAIGRQFVNLWNSWANGDRIDQSDEIRHLVDELRILFGFKKFEISVATDGTQLLITTEEGRFGLNEMGDGISHFIIVLGNAMIRQPSYILIDEPEIGLHPRMQEMFIRVLASKAKIGLLATSHSIGLARSVGDDLLMMTKDENGARNLKPFGDHLKTTVSQSISEMGFSQFSEIGAGHLLLVEGRTDIKAFREILRKFNLDQHFLIWSLNGSDWIKAPPEKIVDELNDLKRLGAVSISIVFDSERTSPEMDMTESVRPFHTLCKQLGFNVFATDRHSTENYISQEALDIICPKARSLSEFEVFGTTGPKWEKSKNWLMFKEMTKLELENSGLGKFIQGTLAPLVSKSDAESHEYD